MRETELSFITINDHGCDITLCGSITINKNGCDITTSSNLLLDVQDKNVKLLN